MNNDPVYQRLRETAWRRKFTDAEQAELRAHLTTHPESQADWEKEFALNDLLSRLPDTPLPSNFTTRVLQSVERDLAANERANLPRWRRFWRVTVPRFALVCLVIATGWFAYRWRIEVQRVKLAESVAAVAEVRAIPAPQMLEDFEAINRLPPMPPADEELLAVMK